MNNRWFVTKQWMTGSLIILLFIDMTNHAAYASELARMTLNFSGMLSSNDICTFNHGIPLTVNFGEISSNELYTQTRIRSQPFTITLTECDITLAKKVSFTFSGNEDTPGSGKIKPTGGASGIAIGITMPDGSLLPLNRATPAFSLIKGDNNFTLTAFVEGESDAIKNRTIVAGDFSAVAEFTIDYP